jgi:hypothetical protein
MSMGSFFIHWEVDMIVDMTRRENEFKMVGALKKIQTNRIQGRPSVNEFVNIGDYKIRPSAIEASRRFDVGTESSGIHFYLSGGGIIAFLASEPYYDDALGLYDAIGSTMQVQPIDSQDMNP